jgi:EmrB/QacA subfamily drug resistance transporter
MDRSIDSAAAPISTRSSKALIFLVASAFFMENLDGTVIATALPQMGLDFHASAIDVSLGMTVYLLTLGILIPISGWVADRFGARLVFTSAIAIFTVASLLCSLSGSLPQFIAWRILQGIGGALMVPVGRLLVLRTTDKSQLIRALTSLTWPGLIAPVLGPPLGGFLTTYASWRWIFFLNIPLGLAGIAGSAILLRHYNETSKRPLDVLGFVLSGSALALLMYGADLAGQTGSVRTALACIAAGAAIGVAAVRHLRRHPHPLVDLSLLRIPSFAVSVWAGSIFRIVISVAPLLLALMFQIAMGLDAFVSGLLVLAIFAGNLLMKILIPSMLERSGFRVVILANGLLLVLSTAMCAFITLTTPIWLIAAILFLGGASRSIQMSAFTTLSFADVDSVRMSSASSLMSAIVQLASGMGIAVGALMLSVAVVVGDGVASKPNVADFQLAFVLTAALGLVGVGLALRLERNVGAAMRSGRRS